MNLPFCIFGDKSSIATFRGECKIQHKTARRNKSSGPGRRSGAASGGTSTPAWPQSSVVDDNVGKRVRVSTHLFCTCSSRVILPLMRNFTEKTFAASCGCKRSAREAAGRLLLLLITGGERRRPAYYRPLLVNRPYATAR